MTGLFHKPEACLVAAPKGTEQDTDTRICKVGLRDKAAPQGDNMRINPWTIWQFRYTQPGKLKKGTDTHFLYFRNYILPSLTSRKLFNYF